MFWVGGVRRGEDYVSSGLGPQEVRCPYLCFYFICNYIYLNYNAIPFHILMSLAKSR